MTAMLLLSLKRLQSASTRAVLPDPTGPPIPILRGLGITIGTTERQEWHGAWRQFLSPARNSRCRPYPYLGLPPPTWRSMALETTEFAGRLTGPEAIGATQQQPIRHTWNRDKPKPFPSPAIQGLRQPHRKPSRDGLAFLRSQPPEKGHPSIHVR